MKPLFLSLLCLPALILAADGNRLAYLEESGPCYPHAKLARFTTPQWIGEPGVEAAVILSIDDLRDPRKWEAYMRPILERLKKIDGRAPFSVMCCDTKPDDPLFQTWLAEGVSLEVHTLAHPCPLLGKADFATATKTVLGGLDLLARIPGNRPLAFRMPCCDSMNSASPRFYSEIFPARTSEGRAFGADSSIMNLITPDDPALPGEIVRDAAGAERFRKYFPMELVPPRKLTFERFGGYIENYPYPYVIRGAGWEFPCAVPSDWEAFNTHGSSNPITTADWKAALDATVIKQGVMTMVLHPHGWSTPEQIIELIDYAVLKYGPRVKFLNFREALERIEKHALAGESLRTAEARDNGVRLLDLDDDGFMDVVIGNHRRRLTRRWDPAGRAWKEEPFPVRIDEHVKFDISAESRAGVLAKGDSTGYWRFDNHWQQIDEYSNGLENVPVGPGTVLRDFDGDGICEILVSTPERNEIHEWIGKERRWFRADYALPAGLSVVDAQGRDAGLRFVDLNQDGSDDILFSNADRYAIHLWAKTVKANLGWKRGWSHLVRAGARTGAPQEPPPIVRAGPHPDNGAWFRNGAMFVQNEDTAKLEAVTDRHTFKELIAFDVPPPKSPAEALKSMRPRPGFKVELVASEPLVVDPIAFDWDARGRLWVVEMRDYPLGIDGKGKPGGVIKILEDTDRDGRYDKATAFLEGLNYPTGVMPWRNGALIAAAPKLIYAEDKNDDGKADTQQVLYEGFIEGNQQHRFNGFEYGLDNWIYCANGDSAGKVRSTKIGAEVDLRGHDFRIRPEYGDIELVEGQTQFGRACDDWGRWFGNNNSRWVWHYPIPERYLTRNPLLTVKSLKQQLAEYDNSSRVYPATGGPLRFNNPDSLGHVTSANSPAPYRDDLFGPEFATSIFISEPVHNAIHREVLEHAGVTFTSHRAKDEQTSEFLTSTDEWFRPAMLKTGPDGALYIADMYRFVIEHPEWIAPETQARLDLRAGEDKGRIYRVVPIDKPARPIPDLSKIDGRGLVAALDSPNGWQRTMAQRLIIQKGYESREENGRWTTIDHVSPSLDALLEKSDNPKACLHALGAMAGLRRSSVKQFKAALRDPHPGVREFAVCLLEPTIGNTAGDAALLESLTAVADDPEIRVRYQLAYSLGLSREPAAGALLARIALRDGADPFMRTAVLSSAPRHLPELIQALLAQPAEQRPVELLSELIGFAAGEPDSAILANAIEAAVGSGEPRYRYVATAMVLDALGRRGWPLDKLRRELSAATQRIDALAADARRLATDTASIRDPELLTAALGLLGRVPAQQAAELELLPRLLAARTPPPVQTAALNALARLPIAKTAPVFLSAWPSAAPTLRQEILTALMARIEGARALLDAVEKREIPAGQLPPATRQSLLRHNDAALRQRAAHLLETTGEDRQKLVQRYLSALPANGDAARGRALFQAQCSPCHRLKGEGVEVGPDLGMAAGKPAEQLLTAILDPNQAIEQRYLAYAATAADGRAFAGLISSESANALTLRAPAGLEQTFLRAELKELASTNRSLMPEGFEQGLTPAQMADLLAYLRAP